MSFPFMKNHVMMSVFWQVDMTCVFTSWYDCLISYDMLVGPISWYVGRTYIVYHDMLVGPILWPMK